MSPVPLASVAQGDSKPIGAEKPAALAKNMHHIRPILTLVLGPCSATRCRRLGGQLPLACQADLAYGDFAKECQTVLSQESHCRWPGKQTAIRDRWYCTLYIATKTRGPCPYRRELIAALGGQCGIALTPDAPGDRQRTNPANGADLFLTVIQGGPELQCGGATIRLPCISQQ